MGQTGRGYGGFIIAESGNAPQLSACSIQGGTRHFDLFFSRTFFHFHQVGLSGGQSGFGLLELRFVGGVFHPQNGVAGPHFVAHFNHHLFDGPGNDAYQHQFLLGMQVSGVGENRGDVARLDLGNLYRRGRAFILHCLRVRRRRCRTATDDENRRQEDEE